ncbi:MAG TPA: hypothetical protein VF399_10000 [bacterium]
MKTYNILKLIVGMLLPLILPAQAPDTLWTRIYNKSDWDEGYSIKQANDGGYVVCGETNLYGNDNYQIYIIKTDANGDTVWTRCYGGSNDELATSVEKTSDNCYVIVGWTTSYGAGGHDIYLLKINQQGDALWTSTYGGLDYDFAWDVAEVAGNGYIIAGVTESLSDSFGDVYLIKTDNVGSIVWSKTYGGDNVDVGSHVQQTYDGGFMIAGWTISSGAGSVDFYLIKTDSLGDTLWTRTYGGDSMDVCYSAQQTLDSGFIMVGLTTSFGAGAGDVYLVKTNSNGDTTWSKTYGGSASEVGFSVQQTQDNGYIICGGTNSYGMGNTDVYLIRVDPWGNLLWSATYGEADFMDEGYCVQTTSDNGYIISGYKESVYTGDRDIYLVRTAPDETHIRENNVICTPHNNKLPAIFSGPLQLPKDKKCRVFDITGRIVMPNIIKPGVYFIQIDGKMVNKIIKVK